ncbi:unnamed protein product [Notodromas monacha]|uniref:Oxysterol-binding protein n=1 Tax=Notodromas monacha TaxID=399045 RepID=A0A7R9BHR9_9CRUS|nr:unnamed protein product [Notodromas monacha]CAG0914357.1 unnamed protein product [Notodromas monacha]
MGEQSQSRPTAAEAEMKGWLYKWTNYIKGYQKRWFVLNDGLLSYYRSPAETNHTCRGTISLHGATISTEDACNFVISTCGTQTWHLKASSEVLRQRWVLGLELAKNKSIGVTTSDDEEDMEMEEMEESAGLDKRIELQAVVQLLNTKLAHIKEAEKIVIKHGGTLLARSYFFSLWNIFYGSLQSLEVLFPKQPDGTGEAVPNAVYIPELQSTSKTINERSTMFKFACSMMINSCREYADLANAQGRKWQRLLQHERDQRLRLEEMVETLARQHSHLEQSVVQEHQDLKNKPEKTRASAEHSLISREPAGTSKNASASSNSDSLNMRSAGPPVSSLSDSDDNEMEFFDALEENDSDFIVQRSATGNNVPVVETVQNVIMNGEKPPISPPSQPGTPKLAGSTVAKRAARKRRTSIPDRPNISVNLWSIMKNCIGKELTKIPMPVNFSEPLSLLQRLTEEYEYSHLLDEAARCTDPCEQLAYIAAFTISPYAATSYRTGKPFNPLLGETYEWDRTEDFGWRVLSEQVSHHPPIAAQHCEGKNWEVVQEFSMSSKFRGKYLQIVPLGTSHLFLRPQNSDGKTYHCTWRKVSTTVHNIIVGKLWMDNHGEMDIINHTTEDKCHLKFIPYSYFSRDVPRKVTGYVTNKEGTIKWVVSGTWDAKIEAAQVVKTSDSESGKPVLETAQPKLLWKANKIPPGAEKCYNLSELAVQLNEMEEGVSPTDSRFRPDQRMMEIGRWDEANQEKVRLEEKQRAARRKREQELEQMTTEGTEVAQYQPLWFTQEKDADTGAMLYKFNNKYWDSKDRQDWSMCPDIY